MNNRDYDVDSIPVNKSILVDGDESTIYCNADMSSEIGNIPLDCVTPINVEDPFSDMYTVGHPLTSALGFCVSADWLTGWHIGMILRSRQYDTYNVPMTGWLTETRKQTAMDVINGLTAAVNKSINNRFNVTWYSTQIDECEFDEWKTTVMKSDIQKSGDPTNISLQNHIHLHQHEWFAGLNIVIHNLPPDRIRKDVLLGELLLLIKPIKSRTTFIIQLTDARDWTLSEYSILCILRIMFEEVCIWVTPFGQRRVYAVCYGGKKVKIIAAEKLLALACNRIKKYTTAGMNVSELDVLRHVVHSMQAESGTVSSSDWCDKYLDSLLDI